MACELKADPRTGLEIVEVPPQHGKYFAELKGCLIHWFGVVDKFNRMWRPQKRVAICSDQCLYLCHLDGAITRCVHIQGLQELILSEQTAIGFRVGAPDYDLCFAVEVMEDREALVGIVSKIYWAAVGKDLPIRRLSGDSGEAMQHKLQLTKPKDWVLKIEPIKSTQALIKLMIENEKKEQEDRRVVQEEFDRIKEGLRAELQRYRSEEYDRMVEQLTTYIKALEEKDQEIQVLKETMISLDDPEIWRKCPNCAHLRDVLESHPNDDKQRIMHLQREIESQRHIVEHLQAAIEFRNVATKSTGGGDGSGQATGEAAAMSAPWAQQLRQELNEANRKNKELQQLILESPFLSAETKQKAHLLLMKSSSSAASAAPAKETISLNDQVQEREREIRQLKKILRDTTFRQLQEIESIRMQFRRYDEEIVGLLEKLFSSSSPAAVVNAALHHERQTSDPRRAALDATEAARKRVADSLSNPMERHQKSQDRSPLQHPESLMFSPPSNSMSPFRSQPAATPFNDVMNAGSRRPNASGNTPERSTSSWGAASPWRIG